MGIREVVLPGHSWVVGDGKSIRFWKDKWLSRKALIDEVIGDPPFGLESVLVTDLWREGAGWDLNNISPWVSNATQLELAAVVVDNFTGACDRLSWGETSDGRFTVSSAYALITRDDAPKVNNESFYNRLWRVIAPERVKTFLWMVSNQVIMTNAERYRRHLGDSAVCPVCKGGIETILHVLRDCPAMSGIWLRIVPA